jgi:hypothetical protein
MMPRKEAAMAKRKVRAPIVDIRASIKRLRTEGERLAARVRRDAKGMRAELIDDVTKLRKDVGDRAGKTIRDLERRVMKQFHAATTERVAALEKRVAKLEKLMVDMDRKIALLEAQKAA